MGKDSDMVLLEDALAIVDRKVRRVKVEREVVDVRDSLGRTLASDAVSRLELPPFNKSAMDGYAVMAWDQRDEYKVLEFVAAGEMPGMPLEAGCATKVMMGAPVPDEAGRVIMIEDAVDLGDGRIKVKRHSDAGNICFKGEDIRIDDVVIKAPVIIGPLEVANMVSCGIDRVEVFRKVNVAILSTGNEIEDDFARIGPGKIMDCNGPLLAGLCREHGLEVVCETIVRDSRELTGSAIRELMEFADIVVLSGGVSMGDLDFVDTVMGDVGLEVLFNRLAVKPGRPMTFASGRKKAVFGLPGNPVSVYLMFHLFVLRALLRVYGLRIPEPVEMPVAEDFKRKKDHRTLFVPGRITADGRIEPIRYHESAHLAALMKADGFFFVEPDIDFICEGQGVRFMRVR